MRKSGKYIARLTHNNNNWTRPSCKDGKCVSKSNKPLYEEKAGFGWEEWLFNPKNRVEENGEIYQYGFLQCFNTTPSNDEKTFEEVFLYTRECFTNNPKEGTFYLVAKIKNIIKLSKDNADYINLHFEQNGNFDSMRNDDCVNKEFFDKGPLPNNSYKINAKFKVDEACIDKNQSKIKIKYYRFKITELKENKPNHKNLFTQLDSINNFIKLSELKP